MAKEITNRVAPEGEGEGEGEGGLKIFSQRG